MFPDNDLHGKSSVNGVKCIRNDWVPRFVLYSRDVRRPKQRCYIDEECAVRHVASHADPEGWKNVVYSSNLGGVVDRPYSPQSETLIVSNTCHAEEKRIDPLVGLHMIRALRCM